MPASKPQSSNPTLRPAPPGPDPTNSPEVQEDFPKPRRGESPLAPPRDLLQLQQLFPWTASLPERLQQGLLWDPSVSPYEVQTPAQLLLYTGKADSQSLDSVLLSRQSQLEGHIIALDIKRSEDQDILQGDLYSQLCVSAWNGNIQGTGCRTWSILRWFPKPGFPKPVRGRREPDCWRFSVLETSEAQDTDKDSLLLLRQLLLSHISNMRYKGPGLPWCFLEHPEDPKLCSMSPSADRCSTISQTQAVQAWIMAMGLTLIHFDECELGQSAVKSTVLATDLPLHHWQGLHCTHEKHDRAPGMSSSDLSRYPPEMMQGLSTAILQHIAMEGSEFPLEVRANSLQPTGGVPAPEVVDRPSTTPVSRLQALLDPTVMVRLGFKVRPLRDGGGKPSPGRSPPPLRKPAPSLVELGKKILQLATNVVDKVIESIHRQDKHHPFPPDLLEQVRSLVPGSNQDTPFDGQPFFLDHLRSMAEMAGDPDFQYFEILKTGVPLGVKEPPLKSPGIWPTKEELKGESPLDGALEDPRGRGNYASAEIHSDDIRKTFLEERDMDMVLGPLTAQEAASLCGCDISELCPGPMAAIDEGDKIRTVYDGSWGGANAHIQANTEERTTAPTVMDCLRAFTGCRRHKKNRDTRSSPMHIGIGPNRMTSGCS